MAAKKLGELLLEEGLIEPEQLNRALDEQRHGGERVGAVLIKLGYISEDVLVEFLSRQFRVPAVNPERLTIPKDISELIPPEIALKYQAVPFGLIGHTLNVAMADPGNLFVIDDIRFLTRKNIQVHVASEVIIKKVLGHHQDQAGNENVDDVLGLLKEDVDVDLIESTEEMDMSFLEDAAEQAPVVKLVNHILMDAIRKQASDIHLEPYEKTMRVRFRIDGVLYEMMRPPLQLRNAVDFPIENHEPTGHCRTASASGWTNQAQSQRARNGIPGFRDAHAFWREGGAEAVGQNRAAARHDQAGI